MPMLDGRGDVVRQDALDRRELDAQLALDLGAVICRRVRVGVEHRRYRREES